MLPPSGVVLSQTLADVLGVEPGDAVTLEVLEGQPPVRATSTVTGLVDDVLGLSAYMDMAALHRMMREGDVVSGALLLVDPARERHAVGRAEGAARRRRRRLQAGRAAELSRHSWPPT